jgi:MoaA/NifB/PqqE/SkfB family radical SAM enzyme
VTAPRYPLEGVIAWNMNTTCNYRCSYCTQRFVDDRGQWASDLPKFLAAFAALPGDWEIKLSGGEPFRHPDFLPAVAQLAQRHRVSVVTNFAAPFAEIEQFCAHTRGRPGLISASLHLEYADPETFLAKARAVAAIHAGKLVVTCVATQANLPRLVALRDHFTSQGVRFNVQPEKQDRDVIDYDDGQRAQLVQLGGHNNTGMIAPSFEGQACWAGARYFIVDHRGEAYRCYPARRQRSERLGNLLAGTFRLSREATPCHYTYCSCSVPHQRGMVAKKDVDDARR